MDAKAFMIVLNYHKKFKKKKKLAMITPEADAIHSQTLFLAVTPYFPWTPELPVIWWLFSVTRTTIGI